MRQTIVLGNGELYVGLNEYSQVSQLTYPYVGKDEHLASSDQHRLGVYVDNQISWLDDGTWQVEQSYPHTSLIAQTIARNDNLGIILEIDDTVDSDLSAFLRNIHIINLRGQTREVALYLHQRFMISNSAKPDDTAYYLADSQAVVHSYGARYFAVGAECEGKPFNQYTVGRYGEGLDGTWRDAEDGNLMSCSVENGRVDSTIGLNLVIKDYSSTRVHYWLAAGKSEREVLFVHKRLKQDGIIEHFHETAKWWQSWLSPAMKVADSLSVDRRARFLLSAMIMRAHIDARGAVLETVRNFDNNLMLYAWPRIGAFAIWPLVRLGFKDEPLRFFDYSVRTLKEDGYYLEKYHADGSPASSLFSRLKDGKPIDPTAIDQAALVLFVFGEYYRLHQDSKIITGYFNTLVTPIADYLVNSIDRHSGLPIVNYNIWNEPTNSCIYTASVIHGALMSAATLAEVENDKNRVVEYRTAADDLHELAQKQLIDEDNLIKDGGEIDTANIFGGFIFGLFSADSPAMQKSIAKAVELFSQAGQCGLSKRVDDNQQRFIVPTLWHAEYCLEVGDEETAESIISWVESCASGSALLPDHVESCEDTTFRFPSVWSHAEYMTAILDSLVDSSAGGRHE